MSSSSPQVGTAAAVGVGTVLHGRYRLDERIAAGGMATIYRAWDLSLERDVAVKVLHPHLADDDSLLRRFRTEARHAAALLHPHIVNVFDQGIEGLPYIVLEYVDGPSLREVLHRRGRLTPAEVLSVVAPVCHALTRAHEAGVIHRDVKPENVLIAADGTPKVADFGIARALAETSHTATGALIGSVHYLAPELVDGREASPASDQYAVGVLLFELLTGRKPLPADSPMAVAVRHATEKVPPPSKFVSDCSRPLDRVVSRATATDPEKRFTDLDALVSALHAAVPQDPTPVRIPPAEDEPDDTLVIPAVAQDTMSVAAAEDVRGRTQRPRRRHRWLWTGLMLLLVAAVTAGGWALWNYTLAPVLEVPAVVGVPDAEAAALLADMGFAVAYDDAVHTLEAPEGSVLDQDPPAASPLRRGRTVTLTLSAGPARIEMPNVIGESETGAMALLTGDDYAFEVRVDRDYSDIVPEGEVQGQAPEAGTGIRQTSEVIINVSLGVEQVRVPDLSGHSQEEATRALAGAKLDVEFVEDWSDDIPEAGQVVHQSIAPGVEVDKGTVITVTISRGALTIAMPDVEGDDLGGAVDELQALGLVVRVIEQPRPQVGPFRRGQYGRVEYQDPQPGEAVQRGETVDLYTFSEAAERAQEDD